MRQALEVATSRRRRSAAGCAAAVGLLLPLLLVGCASGPGKPRTSRPEGEVQARVVEAQPSERYEEADNVSYLRPMPAPDNPAPVYPPAWLPLRLPPAIVSVRLIVDETGAVSDVQWLDANGAPAQEAFYASVRAACRQWKFTPLIQGILEVEKQSDGSIAILEAREKALPFHLDYAFRFSQYDGQPAVSADKNDRRPEPSP